MRQLVGLRDGTKIDEYFCATIGCCRLLRSLLLTQVGLHGTRTLSISLHAYADDLQTYTSCTASDQHIASSRLLSCVADISTWMSSTRLKLNADKTEFIWLGTEAQLAKISKTP